MKRAPDSLADFINEVPESEKTLLVVNRTTADPLIDLLNDAFSNQSVTIAERQVPDGADDLVCLIDDGHVVATSSFEQLRNSFLLVNVDQYRTGVQARHPGRFPDVLTGLTETEFTVAGFPASTKEKLLLVMISRFIEQLALTTGQGELHSTFQQLSRLDDEYGTRRMYEWLGDSGTETHVYGVDDNPEAVTDIDVVVHSGDTEPYGRSWVVAFSPETDGTHSPVDTEPTHAALVAIEIGPNVWRGLWTYDSPRVERILSHIDQEF
ncbi:histidine kinase [Natronomonas sp. F2-12]|uniref:Histidine kinase n=1 Tax=Natronomonas aquatica TaxID=2841590 RepID=A0A9R1CVB1_9EURY|nr:histidine kinase [Natronomonas aquatica]